MIFHTTPIAGLFRIEANPMRDERGAFMRSWCQENFAAAGIDFKPIQASLSENTLKHTLRGMHFQIAPAEEQKLIRCVRGAVHDVLLDLRTDQPSYLQHVAITLDSKVANAVFVPRGIAHGFLSLTDDAVVEYLIDTPYAPALARGVRWNDPAFGIAWPAAPKVISARDNAWPLIHG
ncbi:MAG: dTDP-4-dehydrorhamnose 3,5-epimerase family protein [Alphaproteobacteria bacterium]